MWLFSGYITLGSKPVAQSHCLYYCVTWTHIYIYIYIYNFSVMCCVKLRCIAVLTWSLLRKLHTWQAENASFIKTLLKDGIKHWKYDMYVLLPSTNWRSCRMSLRHWSQSILGNIWGVEVWFQGTLLTCMGTRLIPLQPHNLCLGSQHISWPWVSMRLALRCLTQAPSK